MAKTPGSAATKAKPPTRILFGRCRGEDANHDQCRGAIRQGQGAIILCSCPNHDGESPKCIDCSATGMVDSDARTCNDIEGCIERRAAKQRANPLHQQLMEVQAVAQAAKTAKSAARKANPAGENGQAQPITRAPRPKSGRCQHCGGATKGGLFVAGHDANLKGDLQRRMLDLQGTRKADRVAAAAELIARGWLRKPVPDDIAADAQAMVDRAKSPAEFAEKMASKRMPE